MYVVVGTLTRNTDLFWYLGGTCSDVYVENCLITCGDSIELNKPVLALCQIECALDELCKSWKYDQSSQVLFYSLKWIFSLNLP